MTELTNRKCRPCERGAPPLTRNEIDTLLEQLRGWEYVNGVIVKTFAFKNYYQTMAFVNATAWISHREDHHPDLTVSYGKCRVEYHTHALNGLSENDFICAAKIDKLLDL
jgi:4a-hydroxytetrahydrobiopterin dehydratase